MARPSDLGALEVEIDTNWVRDQDGRIFRERTDRLRPAPCLVVATSAHERHVEIGASVPPAIGDRMEELLAGEPPVQDPARPPDCADECVALMRRARPDAVIQETVCFMIEQLPAVSLAQGAGHSSPPAIVSSNNPERTEILPLLPLDHVNDDRGPWAAVMVGGQVVSVCSTARSYPQGAEAGTWTDPAHRGQGYAAAATACWAALLLPSGRVLFYSTLGSNRSSRAVASRLGLHTIGWMWKILPVPAD